MTAGGARTREVVTPDGVPLRFAIALAGDRAGAFLLDYLLVLAAVLVSVLAIFFLVGWAGGADLALAGALLALFLVRTFYFTFFELSWRGQTPGKRKLGIRVIDARGGPLTAEAIITRNLTRELEVFLPMTALAGPDAVYPGAPAGVALAALAWMLLFGLLPLFNRDRLRVGDLVAGTIVVRAPDARLLDELVAAPASRAADGFAFSLEQLDVYGEYELHVLEGLLRDGPAARPDALAAVAARIQEKIGWDAPAPDDRAFLRAYYTALRGRLERRLLLGRRRAHKLDRS
ncbi:MULTISPECIES: RDD family protein [Anaeromyxobacter]|uniref:RDD family protein n=1 Tax=Anaeromyxobacter TaxID=161492 RepID=UPI001F55B068|nr:MULTISPECIES: RDD family protein [unclassified Anaeromyxobacter]